MQRVQEELRGYADRGGQKRPSYREQYNKRIQELEQQSARDSPNSQFHCFISPATINWLVYSILRLAHVFCV